MPSTIRTRTANHPTSQHHGKHVRRVQARKSPVHGRGLFALSPIGAGDQVIEYLGARMSMRAAERRWKAAGSAPHTFLWVLADGSVIDGSEGGNSARWMNHSCKPNVSAEEVDGRVYIRALRAIAAGEELFLNYNLVSEERHTAALKKLNACHCGARRCRGTMLGDKR